jgi:hypothetical protein
MALRDRDEPGSSSSAQPRAIHPRPQPDAEPRFAELTYAECADALRIPIGTVRSRYARARRELRVLLDEPDLDNLAFNTAEERTVR